MRTLPPTGEDRTTRLALQPPKPLVIFSHTGAVLAVVLIVLVSPTHAELLGIEKFSAYSDGPVTSSGTADAFWSSQWVADGTQHIAVATPITTLDYQTPRGATLGGSKVLRLSTAPEPLAVPGFTREVTRTFTPLIGGSIYLGMLLRISEIGDGTDELTIEIINAEGSAMRSLRFTPNQGESYPGTIWSGNQGSQMPDGDQTTVYHLLFKLSAQFIHPDGVRVGFVSGGGLNPASDGPVAGSVSYTAGGVGGVRFKVRSADSAGDSTVFDIADLRVGTCWDAVYPPDPTSSPVSGFTIEPAHQLRWFGKSGKWYQRQVATTLDDWDDLGTPIAGQNQFIELFQKVEGPKRFYRIVESSNP